MGKVSVLSEKQKIILNEVKKDEFLTSEFYFTGGTALSEVYLRHRESLDLDFFSPDDFNPQAILDRLNHWSSKYNFQIEARFVDPTHIYLLHFKDGHDLKLDFAHFPYKQLNTPKLYRKRLKVDSQLDIAVNKLLSVLQRAEVKDFVDLYFLMKEYNFWSLRDGVRGKFNVKIEPMIAAADFLVVEDFGYLPKMIKPLSLNELKKFFRDKARELGKTAVE